MIGDVLESFRREVEQSDRVEDLMIYSNSMGGSGSGLTNLLLQRLSNEYPKANTVSFSVVPPPSMLGSEVVS